MNKKKSAFNLKCLSSLATEHPRVLSAYFQLQQVVLTKQSDWSARDLEHVQIIELHRALLLTPATIFFQQPLSVLQ